MSILDRMFTEFHVEMEIMPQGSIRSIFNRKKAPAPIEHHELNPHGMSCVHTEMVLNQADGTYDRVRCEEVRVYYPQQSGWLCAIHDEELNLMAQRRTRRVWVDKDKELTDSIIAMEQAGLNNTIREIVTEGKLSIHFVSGTID